MIVQDDLSQVLVNASGFATWHNPG